MKETGRTVELKVSGKVRRGNLIAYDSKTGAEFLQETGRAIEGEEGRPAAGERAQTLPALPDDQCRTRIRWDEWRRAHPRTRILHCDHCGG